MSSMKKIIFLTLVLFTYATSLFAQITREQADAIVLEYLQNEISLPYVLYINMNVPSETGIVISTYNDEDVKVKYACWVYYLNEFPNANGACQHRYLFVKEDNGNLLEIITTNDFGPELTEWIVVLPLSVIKLRENNISIYPNPTTDELQITNYELRIDDIEIFDVFGRMQKLNQIPEIEKSEIVINISHLNTGIYFVKIITETGVQTQKIIKL